MLRKAFGCVAVLAAILAGAYAYEFRISRVNTWELGFASKPPRVLEILEADGLAAYTYVVYEVTNNTGGEIDFYPTFFIEGEDGKITRAALYPAVYSRLAKRLGKKLLPFSRIAGAIKPGETKKGVAIFKGADPGADKVTVYVAGLCGDLKTEKTQTGRLVAKYRTFRLIYKRPGDEFHAGLDPVVLESTDWVWRE